MTGGDPDPNSFCATTSPQLLVSPGWQMSPDHEVCHRQRRILEEATLAGDHIECPAGLRRSRIPRLFLTMRRDFLTYK
jgi:hypothetical protein